MTRRSLTVAAVLLMCTVTLTGCTPVASDAVGVWVGDDGMTLRLDRDGTAELDHALVTVLNLSGRPGTHVDGIVGTWTFDDGRVHAAFDTANGDRELVLRFADTDTDSLAIDVEGQWDAYAYWMQRDDGGLRYRVVGKLQYEKHRALAYGTAA